MQKRTVRLAFKVSQVCNKVFTTVRFAFYRDAYCLSVSHAELKVDVVEAAYSVLRSTLAGVEDFVCLQRAHQEFLSTLRMKFYLDNLDISQVMMTTS